MADRIIRDIPLIKRYSRHNDAQDMTFRNFLKYECSLSNADLDARVQEVTDEVWKQIDCLSCANCCRTLQPTLDKEDIARLSKRLGLSVREFTRRYTRKDPMEPGETIMARAPCPLLGEDNRCTVYDDRPKACRDYPYLHAKDFRTRSYFMLNSLEVCPIVFNVWQELKARLHPRRSRGRRKFGR